MTNDGYRRQEGARKGTGSGLSGLTERVTAHGGRIEAGPLRTSSEQGYRLWVELPIHGGVTTEKEL